MSLPLRVDTNILAFSIPFESPRDIGFEEVFTTLCGDDDPSSAKVDAIDIGSETYVCDISGRTRTSCAYLIDTALFSDAAVCKLVDLARETACQQIILVNRLGEAVDVRDADVPVWVGYWQESKHEPDSDVFDYFKIDANHHHAGTITTYYVADKLTLRGAKKRAVNI